QAGDPAQAEALGMTDLNGGAFFNTEFGIGHRGNTVPERSGVALSFCGRPMSSLIAEFRQTEEAIKELHARLEQLKSDERLIRELDFADELKQLMIRYDRNELAVLNVLFPDQ